ncbi:hypothetical protein D3C78_1794610 [compost metagenome]
MWPLVHQWSARYPGVYSTIRTRMFPNCWVRQYAVPVTPLCSVGSMVDQSVVPKGMPVMSMSTRLLEGSGRM